MSSSAITAARLSRWIRLGALVFLAGVFAIHGLTWFVPEFFSQGHPVVLVAGVRTSLIASLDPQERIVLAAASLPYLAVLAWAFHRLVRMLRQFEAGRFFERSTVSDLRAFSGLLLVAKLLALAGVHVRAALVAHVMAKGASIPVVNLSSDDLAILLLCALFFAIAGMMEEARRLAEENREFV